MSKTEYMGILKKKLSRLPKDDYDRAVEYFEEYFADAGEEQEEQAMEDLGSPETAAEQIIREIAINNTKEPVKDVKKGLNAVWVGILAVCAAPIALPLVIVGIGTVLVLIASAFLVLASLFLVGVALLVTVPVCIAGGVISISTGFPTVLSCIGIALFALGAGMALMYGMVCFSKWFLTWVINGFGRMLNKGGKKNEEQK